MGCEHDHVSEATGVLVHLGDLVKLDALRCSPDAIHHIVHLHDEHLVQSLDPVMSDRIGLVLVCKLLACDAMATNSSRVAAMVVSAALALQLTGCGTILYPERRGTTGGRIDTGVAVMDGLWCLLFIVPGVVAYIVDFSNGAIYEGGSRR